MHGTTTRSDVKGSPSILRKIETPSLIDQIRSSYIISSSNLCTGSQQLSHTFPIAFFTRVVEGSHSFLMINQILGQATDAHGLE
jgi:hypothetical protein